MVRRADRVRAGVLALLAGLLGACGEETTSAPASPPAGAVMMMSAQKSVAAQEATDSADSPRVVESLRFTASDGVQLHAWLGGAGDLRPRPLIIEFTPYAQACCGPDFGPDYNYLQVHVRGTGLSGGVWSAVGPRDQQDIAEFLAWACAQPWSNGHIGLYGFSASAIAVYNSLHLPLACVDAAALMAGTNDLYRDLLYPGGIMNFAPAATVAFGVGGPLLQTTPDAMAQGMSPLDRFRTGLGLFTMMADVLTHTSEDAYWLGHTQRPGPNRFPVLADTSFYDPEPRGPFQSYQDLRKQGVDAHFRLFGAHDGFPAGTPGPFPEYRRWFDRYLLGLDNGVEREPRVQMLVGNGGFGALKSGDFTRINADDWPVPGTRWQPVYLDAARSSSARSTNDGSLSALKPVASTGQTYAALVSLPTATDPHTTGTVAAAGAGTLFDALSFLTQLSLMEPLALTYTTPVFTRHVDVVGPANLVLHLATLMPVADIHAVIADVWPDGSAHAVGVGRLRTSYPDVIRERSLLDEAGNIVQPYGDFSAQTLNVPGRTREYQVEFWPIGNRFQEGHRLRLYLLGTSGYQLPAPGLLNRVSLGGDTPSRLLLPVLPGSDALAAMGDR